MQKTEQDELLEGLQRWENQDEEDSPAEQLTFVFEKQKDYEKCCTEMVDKRGLKLFAKFEKADT